MVAKRLTESKKKELVERYRNGIATSVLAELYGCSPNTVSRTVKTYLSKHEYEALKASRGRGGAGVTADCEKEGHRSLISLGKQEINEVHSIEVSEVDFSASANTTKFMEDSQAISSFDTSSTANSLALLDDNQEKSSSIDSLNDSRDEENVNVFHEIPPLDVPLSIPLEKHLVSDSLASGLLPPSVYMLVDKTDELEIRSLKDFPELGIVGTPEEDLKAICLFESPRSARRQFGRSQRVIKIPDSSILKLSIPYLLAKGITRLVVEGSVICLDASKN